MLSDTSFCNVNGEKDTSIKITYENGLVGISDITKKVKCHLYFDKIKGETITDKIKVQSKGEKTSFTGIATSSDTGVYEAPDDYGTSYYFRGLEGSLNNWVKFAGFYWRIIRVNGNGTIRMIYQGVANDNVSSTNKIGPTTQIVTSTMYNNVYKDNTYVGYMTSNGKTNSYETAHINMISSNAKIQIDSWYAGNIESNKEYAKHADINTGFCNDRGIASGHSNYTGGGYGTGNTIYNPADRIKTTNSSGYKTAQTPSLQCANKIQDLFTTSTSDSENIGNKKLTYPVGMITSDEVVFAGGFGGKENLTFYLYTSQHYWTMSPSGYHIGGAVVIRVDSQGYISENLVNDTTLGLRPVLNLRADTHFTGEGSETSPFEVV